MTTQQLRKLLSSDSIAGSAVQNFEGDHLGEIKDLMIDLATGRIGYVVLSFGGLLGIGDKLFAIPWQAFSISQTEKTFYLDVPKEKLEQAPGFDKDEWPDMADYAWGTSIHDYYGYKPYWK